MSVREQRFCEVRADEAGTAGDKDRNSFAFRGVRAVVAVPRSASP